MITSIYAALLAILIVGLSLNVIKLRQIGQVILGDGDNLELQSAIRAQGNATEYIPISLILLLLLELSKGHWSLLHIGGIVLLTGRLIHARGLLKGNLRFRVLGMQLTLFNIIYLAIANLVYLYFKP
ncbi:MAG: MAPEG family protein [Pseudanabaena sp.]|jgi:uncharacterized membrane protein YecN with MAPEG domain|nr:MAPEG family protein [Pseudanabaena sp. M079S1SP2A07QC]MCA6588675.1 MAPEG family protein [Pseudanabaena sp. M109S1SP1A06QC]MCA6606153.1 MAPEG family protein [Pseudanabaena sp. M007S1SP1A06QC]MCA6624037.1 MAPEG family protein [Pseudanabaena sp. M165S2SP1A06QC]MCE2977735.1 MAPEG family protein [Pseudanabaena sp. CoA8_M7]